jgi:predicted PurR-regulated permease PerM
VATGLLSFLPQIFLIRMDSQRIPFYAKAALVFVAAYGFIYALYIGQSIIVPIVYATILAVLLNPFVNFLVRKKFPKILAITLAVTVVFILTAALVYFISTQVSMIADTYPQLKAKTAITSKEFIDWFSVHFNVKIEKINGWIKSTEELAYSDAGSFVGRTLVNLSGMVIVLVLLPVYLFMILFYKTLLLEFIRKLFRNEYHGEVLEVLDRTKVIIHGYLKGLMVEALVVAVLNSAGLLILGIDYAIILGITGAILNVIPYIGGVIAIGLPMVIAYVTKDSITYPLLVLGVYTIIQFIDNHYIIPRVVASKVKINALISVVVVLVGGALWGLPGMFLSIPLTAILKVIFDHIEPLKAWGFLLGDIVPSATKFSFLKTKPQVR